MTFFKPSTKETRTARRRAAEVPSGWSFLVYLIETHNKGANPPSVPRGFEEHTLGVFTEL